MAVLCAAAVVHREHLGRCRARVAEVQVDEGRHGVADDRARDAANAVCTVNRPEQPRSEPSAVGGTATTFAMPVAATFALRRRRYLLIPGTRGSHSSNPTLSDIGRDGTRGIDTGGYDRV